MGKHMSGKAKTILTVMKLFKEMTAAEISRKLGGELNPRQVAGVIGHNLMGEHVQRRMEPESKDKWVYWRFA